MNIHSVYGLSLEEHDWVPAPRYLLRRDRILALLKDLPRGNLLEIGCGAGTLLHDLKHLGFFCRAVEISEEARTLARKVHANDNRVSIHEQFEEVATDAFDYVLSFEVLEHIEDDLAALLQWKEALKTGGHLLLSVPAHQKYFSDADVLAGHYRRYERNDLRELLESAGFQIVKFECYGFPLANAIRPIKAKLYGRQLQERGDPSNFEESTKKSGIKRGVETKLYPLQKTLPVVLAYRLFSRFQNLFLETNLGEGFLVIAKKVD